MVWNETLSESFYPKAMSLKIEYLTPLLQVFNMPRSLAFFRDVLGFTIVSDSGNRDESSWVWIQKDGCHLMLNDQYEPDSVPSECPPARIRWHKDTCLYLGCRDVESAYRFLRDRGLFVEPPTTAPYGMRQLYLIDPDGYNICFQESVDYG